MTTQDPQQMVTVPRALLEPFISEEAVYLTSLDDEAEEQAIWPTAGAIRALRAALSASPPAPEDMRERVRGQVIAIHKAYGMYGYDIDRCDIATDEILAALSPVAVAGKGDGEPDPNCPDCFGEGYVETGGDETHTRFSVACICTATDTPKAQPLATTGDEALREALDNLQQAEAAYRKAHDLHGDADRYTGRMWDLMRRAGDKARTALATQADETNELGFVDQPLDSPDGRIINEPDGLTAPKAFDRQAKAQRLVGHVEFPVADRTLGLSADVVEFAGYVPDNTSTTIAGPADEERLTSGGDNNG